MMSWRLRALLLLLVLLMTVPGADRVSSKVLGSGRTCRVSKVGQRLACTEVSWGPVCGWRQV